MKKVLIGGGIIAGVGALLLVGRFIYFGYVGTQNALNLSPELTQAIGGCAIPKNASQTIDTCMVTEKLIQDDIDKGEGDNAERAGFLKFERATVAGRLMKAYQAQENVDAAKLQARVILGGPSLVDDASDDAKEKFRQLTSEPHQLVGNG